MERYVIRGGQGGYERLLILARDRGPDTSALLTRAGVGPGLRCVDLGCGGGEVTLEMARMVAPDGTATGVDMDEVKLELARHAAAQARVENVEFRSADVNEWAEPDGYDVVYARFLLQHLRRPDDLLARMWAAVRTGGVLVVEDADFGGWCCHPPNDGFDFFRRTYDEVLRRSGGDQTYGRRLYASFLACGIPPPEVVLVQRAALDGEAKALAWLTLEGCREAIVAAGVASAEDVATALADLGRFTNDPHTLICGPRVFQAWSAR